MNTFVNQNSKWMLPVLAMLIVVSAPLVAEMGGISVGLPSWFTQSVLIIGMLCAGFGAFVTQTLAARIVRIVIPALLLAVALFKIFG